MRMSYVTLVDFAADLAGEVGAADVQVRARKTATATRMQKTMQARIPARRAGGGPAGQRPALPCEDRAMPAKDEAERIRTEGVVGTDGEDANRVRLVAVIISRRRGDEGGGAFDVGDQTELTGRGERQRNQVLAGRDRLHARGRAGLREVRAAGVVDREVPLQLGEHFSHLTFVVTTDAATLQIRSD